MTAYRLTILKKEDLAEINIQCPICRTMMTVKCLEPTFHIAAMEDCGICGKKFDVPVIKVIEAFVKLHAAMDAALVASPKVEFEFPIRNLLD